MDKIDTHLQIGVVTRPHGVRGELKVRLFNEASTCLDEVDFVICESPRGESARHEIENVRGGGAKGVIVALASVQSREDAERMRGHTLWVERASMPPLEPGEYYLVDLIGCEVLLEGRRFGIVTDVRPDPSVDTMVLELEGGKKAEVPIVDAWVGQVDVAQKTVELLSTDGVIEA